MSFVPLSACPLWKHQREFFETLGVDAWLAGGVPHHITSNAFMADAYARIIHAYLRENEFDPAQPVNIVELGAGHGRLSYQLVRRLLDRLDRFPIEGLRIRYVMTDLARRNVEYWRGHGWLQNYIEAGLLDMAEFDAGRDEEIRLEISGETLSAKNCRNPLVAIANYVFDSIPQDSFRIEDGRLFETLIAVARPEDAPVEQVLAGVKIEYRREPVAGARYGNPLWNELLEGYRARLSPVADILVSLDGPAGDWQSRADLARTLAASRRRSGLRYRRRHAIGRNVSEAGRPRQLLHAGGFSVNRRIFPAARRGGDPAGEFPTAG